MAQKYSIQLLAATTEQWNASQYVVPEGELVAELLKDKTIQLKIGNGLQKFSDLRYVADKGPRGEQGFSPVVSTSHEGGIATITITDLAGDHSVQVHDGVSPTVSTDKSNGVATITITDFSGAHTFTINDGMSPTVKTSKTDGVTTITITDSEGDHVFTLNDGAKGDPFTFADLTEAQKLELKGDTGEGFKVQGTYNTLSALQSGVVNPDTGDAYAVGTTAPYDIYIYDGVKAAWVNHGPLQGAKGDNGAVFTPNVTTDGTLSWTNNGGLTNPATVNIKGATGVGISGITRTSGNGSAGTVDTYTITYTDATTSTFNVTNGAIPDVSGKLDVAGGIMTGALTLSGDPVDDLHAVTKQYVDNLLGDIQSAVDEINGILGGT